MSESAEAAAPGLTVLRQEPLSRHTIWRVGGAAESWWIAESEEDILRAIAQAKTEDIKLQPWESDEQLPGEEGGGAWLSFGQCALGAYQEEQHWNVGARWPCAALGVWAEERGYAQWSEALRQRSGTLLEAYRSGWLRESTLGARVLRGSKILDLAEAQLRKQHALIRLRLHPDQPPELEPLRPGRALSEPGAETWLEEIGLGGLRLRGVQVGRHEFNTLITAGGAQTRDLELLLKMMQDRLKHERGLDVSPTQRRWRKRRGA